ncbi:hypothetical protein FA15DRAFT_553571, partial [Coprinopsis marcescibilis]
DDRLTALEEDLIVGTYVCSTGHGNPPALKSWWPLAEVFDRGEFSGRWTQHWETWYCQRLREITTGTAQPHSVREWCNKLRGRPETRKIVKYLESSSRAFI